MTDIVHHDHALHFALKFPCKSKIPSIAAIFHVTDLNAFNTTAKLSVDFAATRERQVSAWLQTSCQPCRGEIFLVGT
jgi:hypothetical protein